MKTVVQEVYTVRHDVPMPHAGKGSKFGRPPKYPFASMKVGDSFVTSAGDDLSRKAATLRNAACSWGSRQVPKWRFSVQQLLGTNEVGVWRIE